MEEHTATLRLYVGGLGERVTQEDINKTFCNLGAVQSVEIIRTKGRSFAYINFLPSSHNSLAKLFSTYNGCAWKGGKLKLEKAKEHYLDRLKREWAEEAELKTNEHINQGDADVSIVDSPDPQGTLNLKDMEFRLFFPKLRKVKPLPLSGTGKHKYSFRRLEAPPVPVHFCDCPEHSVLVQTRAVAHANDTDIKKGGINKKGYNTISSVKNRFVRQETYSEHKKAVVHDSIIQDDGMNEEEINMMDSVMKKLLDRGTCSKKDPDRFSQKKTALDSEIQEITNDTGYEIEEDDDIKINVVSAENFSSSSSRSWERQESLQNEEIDEIDDETVDDDDDDDIQINAVYGRNGRQTSSANKITRLNEMAGSSIRKRKSVSIETNTNDMTSPINEKKGLLNIPSKKPAWKQLVGDGSSSSFTLSQITSENDTNLEKQPEFGKKASLDNKKSKRVSFVLPEENTPSDEPPTGSEEEEDNSGVLRDSQLYQHNKKSKKIWEVVPDKPKPSDELPAGEEEHDLASNFVEMGLSVQHDEIINEVEKVASEEPKLSDEIPAGSEEHGVANKLAPRDSTPSQSNNKRKKARKVASGELKPRPRDEPPAGSEEHDVANKFVKTDQSAQHDKTACPPVTQGNSWLQKSTWTQLTGGGNDSSFSISQILPGDLVQKQNSQAPDDFSTVSFISTGGAFSNDQRTSEMTSDGPRRKDAQLASVPRDMDLSKASEGTDLSNSGTNTKCDSSTKSASSYSIRGVQLSESCPFMRNADSMKEWKTAKSSMSNSLKKMKKK